MALICDTGPLLAALDRSDPDHGSCAELLRRTVEDVIVPGLVLTELDYWCTKYELQDAWLTFLEDRSLGRWRAGWPTDADLDRSVVLQVKYGDLPLGLVDASVVALAERMGEGKIATLDRRHFSMVRPVHVPAFHILPE